MGFELRALPLEPHPQPIVLLTKGNIMERIDPSL
jgi:hypothetical protein